MRGERCDWINFLDSGRWARFVGVLSFMGFYSKEEEENECLFGVESYTCVGIVSNVFQLCGLGFWGIFELDDECWDAGNF